MTIKYRIVIEHDSDADDPSTSCDGTWKIYTFLDRHHNYKDPDHFFVDGKPKVGLRNKLRVGLAFLLDYSEHGLCRWDIAGEGMQDQWDTSRYAGIAIWEDSPDDMGAKTLKDRAQDLRNELETYTDWCNGQCYWFSIEEVAICECCSQQIPKKAKDLESCGGLIGTDALLDCLQEQLPEDATKENTEFKGGCADALSYRELFPQKTPA